MGGGPVIIHHAVAYGFAGPDETPAELVAAALALPSWLQQLLALPGVEQRTFTDDVTLSTMDHRAKIRNKDFKGGEVDGGRWRKAIESVGPRGYSAALDVSPVHAELQAGTDGSAPSVHWRLQHRAGLPTDDIGRVLFDWLVSVAPDAGVTTGAVSIGPVPLSYETWVARPLWTGRLPYERTVPGYEWAVVLRGPHIEALGGVDAVKAGAPVAEVVEAGPDALVCRVTDAPTDFDDDRRAAWRRYLLPVLPEGFAVWSGDDEPTGLLERPVLPTGVQGALKSAPGRAIWTGAVAPTVAVEPEATSGTVVVPWGERPRDAEAVEVWRTIVAAWAWVGAGQGFRDVDGVLAGHGEPVADDEGITVEVDFGPCDVTTCLTVLSHALGNAARDLGTVGNERFGVISLR